jgi:hypothetical protein
MLKWQFHQYSGYKKPFVWHVIGVTEAGRPNYDFVPRSITRRSQTGKFGDFEFAIVLPGLYKVGHQRSKRLSLRIPAQQHLALPLPIR